MLEIKVKTYNVNYIIWRWKCDKEGGREREQRREEEGRQAEVRRNIKGRNAYIRNCVWWAQRTILGCGHCVLQTPQNDDSTALQRSGTHIPKWQLPQRDMKHFINLFMGVGFSCDSFSSPLSLANAIHHFIILQNFAPLPLQQHLPPQDSFSCMSLHPQLQLLPWTLCPRFHFYLCACLTVQTLMKTYLSILTTSIVIYIVMIPKLSSQPPFFHLPRHADLFFTLITWLYKLSTNQYMSKWNDPIPPICSVFLNFLSSSLW